MISNPRLPAAQSETPASDPYVLWQKRHKIPLFRAGDTWWRVYRDVLIPASLKPEPVQVDCSEARALLRQSAAYFLRCFTRTSENPTEFWYVSCDEYDFEKLPGKMRTKIRRAYKDCAIEKMDPAWVAENGYECYSAAFSRYKDGKPASREVFREECLRCVDGPFEFWGAFIGETLAAYAKCVLGNDYVTMVAFKIHPQYTSSRPAYALQDVILRRYVAEEGKPLNNGFRALAHDTNMQDFLLQFGYKRVYTDLHLVYRPWGQSLIDLLYPFHSLISRLPTAGPLAMVQTLLRQEEIRRSCLPQNV